MSKYAVTEEPEGTVTVVVSRGGKPVGHKRFESRAEAEAWVAERDDAED